jgi:hypothetical protein
LWCHVFELKELSGHVVPLFLFHVQNIKVSNNLQEKFCLLSRGIC